MNALRIQLRHLSTRKKSQYKGIHILFQPICSEAEVSVESRPVEQTVNAAQSREFNRMQALVGSLETERGTLLREVTMLRNDQASFKTELQRLMDTNSMLELDCGKSVILKRQLENELGEEKMKYREL